MAEASASKKSMPSEMVIPEKWDACLERTLINFGIGLVVGGASAIVLSRKLGVILERRVHLRSILTQGERLSPLLPSLQGRLTCAGLSWDSERAVAWEQAGESAPGTLRKLMRKLLLLSIICPSCKDSTLSPPLLPGSEP